MSALRAIVVMGVSGAGKTTVGQALARNLDWHFEDADDWHPAENVARMSAGQPLTDEDRAPWLDRLNHLLLERDRLVLACSALKRAYRDRLREGLGDSVGFVHLRAKEELLLGRLRDRRGHYMPASLLQSQLDALEEPGPDEAFQLDAAAMPGDAVSEIITHFGLNAA